MHPTHLIQLHTTSAVSQRWLQAHLSSTIWHQFSVFGEATGSVSQRISLEPMTVYAAQACVCVYFMTLGNICCADLSTFLWDSFTLFRQPRWSSNFRAWVRQLLNDFRQLLCEFSLMLDPLNWFNVELRESCARAISTCIKWNGSISGMSGTNFSIPESSEVLLALAGHKPIPGS